MVRQATLKGTLDDALLKIRVTDFSGGLNSETDPIDLPLNASIDCQNVKITQPGRLIGRDGYTPWVESLAAKPDGIAFFYDSDGSRRCAVWHSGNIYSWDFSSSSLTSVASSVYASGTRVAWAALNGKLYYSDGDTIHSTDSGIRYWDPVAGTEGRVVSSGTSGTISTPAARVLTVYSGALILGGIKYVDGTTARHSFMWSSVNDPTTINGTSIQKVGEGHGGTINSIRPLSVASTGVSPFRALVVGKSEFGLYGYSGALGSLVELLINCPTGVKDGDTMQYIPGPDGSGWLVFLGTDYKVWAISGTQAQELSGPIRTELKNYIQDRLADAPTQRFTSVVYDQDFQYILDVGGDRQYVYHYSTGAWSRYDGWPSGHWVAARSGDGGSIIYCADRTNNAVVQPASGIDDDGTAINPYWTTKFLDADSRNIFKIWKWIYVEFKTDTGNMKVVATVNQNRGNSCTNTITLTDADLENTDSTGRWDIATWDEFTWAASAFGVFRPYKKKARLAYIPSSGDGNYTNLKGYDVTIKLTTTVSGAHFELLHFTVMYLARGLKRVVNS